MFVSSPSVAHTGSSLVGAGAAPAEPARARGDYARTKAAAELLALAADAPGFAVTAVRPHLVWGPGDTQLIGRIVDRARSGRLPVLDSGAALIDTLYVDNAASAMVAALEHAADDAVHGAAHVVTNGEPRPVADLLAGICAASGVPAPRLHVPAGVARVAGSLVEALWRVRPGQDEPPMTRFLAEQLSTAHWFDQRRTRQDLRWTPAVSIDEGLERLAAAQTSSRRRRPRPGTRLQRHLDALVVGGLVVVDVPQLPLVPEREGRTLDPVLAGAASQGRTTARSARSDHVRVGARRVVDPPAGQGVLGGRHRVAEQRVLHLGLPERADREDDVHTDVRGGATQTAGSDRRRGRPDDRAGQPGETEVEQPHDAEDAAPDDPESSPRHRSSGQVSPAPRHPYRFDSPTTSPTTPTTRRTTANVPSATTQRCAGERRCMLRP